MAIKQWSPLATPLQLYFCFLTPASPMLTCQFHEFRYYKIPNSKPIAFSISQFVHFLFLSSLFLSLLWCAFQISNLNFKFLAFIIFSFFFFIFFLDKIELYRRPLRSKLYSSCTAHSIMSSITIDFSLLHLSPPHSCCHISFLISCDSSRRKSSFGDFHSNNNSDYLEASLLLSGYSLSP